MIRRVFSTKKAQYDVAARKLLTELREVLSIQAEDLKIFQRYDIEGLDDEFFDIALNTIFSELPLDQTFIEQLPELDGYRLFAVEYLPGQYDQERIRPCNAWNCLRKNSAHNKVRQGLRHKGISGQELTRVKQYLINPIESREGSMEKPQTLEQELICAEEVETARGFINFDNEELTEYYNSQAFAMSMEDLKFVQEYFIAEKRDPTVTELKVIDTYWSDHCRHTTFMTEITGMEIDSDNPHISKAWDMYGKLFNEINAGKSNKYKCLMDIATIAAKKLKASGALDNLDESDEINACSVVVDVDNDGKSEEWLIMFKNETHNHPTEIEPFGGAATCLGGAIRDPLSGRSYVYQAMRITGSADPNEKISDTLKGKLPQRVITTTAAAGFSSYGNQIGLATGIVNEIYHENYKAKRLECGYVIGGAPKSNVVDEAQSGDIVLLVGGETEETDAEELRGAARRIPSSR